ncbi:hypothetical protein CLIM01_00178 [Colletotrichum limetticola]|uniref:Uncharacterized protein n=1 Tax=Colletotrichum limetticola TaxID=1209924 RepID=A0ABQ9QFA9_9PEZI|nr:hypothetical protein CLIM01_00178 [Colletotrichum limetticola]
MGHDGRNQRKELLPSHDLIRTGREESTYGNLTTCYLFYSDHFHQRAA